MDILKNKNIIFLDGYLSALSDMECPQGKNVIRAFIKNIDEKKIQHYLKEKFIYMNDIELIKEKRYHKSRGLYCFLEKMILLDSCVFEEHPAKTKAMSILQNNYRRYIISHLMDYIDFVFEEVGDEINQKDIIISLLSNDNKNFISLAIKGNHVELFLIFFRDEFDREEFIQYFDRLIQYCQDNLKEYSSEEKVNNDNILANGLSLKEGKEIFEPLVKKAIKLGYLDEESKKIIRKYFSEEKINEFEKALFD